MKKIWIYICLLLPLASCNDWLNIESEGDITYQNLFKNEQDVVAIVNGMFVDERTIEIRGLPKMLEYAGLCCDEMVNSGFKTLDADYFFGRGVAVSTGNSWAPYYRLIYMANLLEENRYRFQNIKEERADFWLAQANFMKAYAYFRVAQMWGDAPIPANSSNLDAIGKSPVREVLAAAVKAAEKALILPPYDQLKDAYGKAITSKQYASLGTVNTLLAQIYAWMGGLYDEPEYWQKAEEYATLVIGDGPKGQIAGRYVLEPMETLIKNVFGSGRKSDEIIFSITYSSLDFDFPGSPIKYSAVYPGYLLLNYPVVYSDPADMENKYGDYTGARITMETVNDLFPFWSDKRNTAYWLDPYDPAYEDVQLSDEYAYLIKWREIILSNQESTDPIITAIDADRVIWRLADLKLLRAECRARLNKPADEILIDLNDVRARAEAESYDGLRDAETLRKEIFKERERELFGEGHHYFDAVRNGVNPRDNYYLRRISVSYSQLSDKDIQNGALYIPVNGDAFTKNLNMTQNTYWLWRK